MGIEAEECIGLKEWTGARELVTKVADYSSTQGSSIAKLAILRNI